jgi:hypothetical protein
VYNNTCITDCPNGYKSITNSNGEIISMYCMAECPLVEGSKTIRWPFIGGLCVKEFKTRTAHIETSTTNDSTIRQIRPLLGIPQTPASVLANKPLGSSLPERYRAGQSIQNNIASSPSTNPLNNIVGGSWLALIESPADIIFFVGILIALIFLAPKLFPLLGSGLGSLFKGIGAAGGAVIGATGETVAAVEKGIGTTVGAAIAVPGSRLAARNLQVPLERERQSVEALSLAQEQLLNTSEALKELQNAPTSFMPQMPQMQSMPQRPTSFNTSTNTNLSTVNGNTFGVVSTLQSAPNFVPQ